MALLAIRKEPDAILHKKARRVRVSEKIEKSLLDNMEATMRARGGVGLAGPQVGLNKSIAVVDTKDGALVLVNPEIISKKGATSFEEGCLSVPGQTVKVRRFEEVTVSYSDENKEQKTRVFKGLTAIIVQHEIDHLNGTLIMDHRPWYKKILKKPKSRRKI